MSTIKDIAELAGVSHGTVSNVLNKKSNVSLEKIRRVEEAMQKLGYKVDVRARNLRQKKSFTVAIIIPTLALQHYSDLYQSLKSALTEKGVLLQLFLTDGAHDTERKAIEQIVTSNIDTIVSVSCLPTADSTYDGVPEDISLYFVGRKIACENRKSIFVTFQYDQAAKDLAQYVIQCGYKRAAYFADTKRFAERNQMFVTLQELLEQQGCSTDFYASDNSLMLKEAFELFQSNVQYDVIITSNVDRAQAVASVHNFISDNPPPTILTLAVPKIIAPDSFVRYELNFKRMGRAVGARILKNNAAARRNLSDIVMENDGLAYRAPPLAKSSGEAGALRLLMPECPAASALRQIAPNFAKHSACTLQIDTAPASDLYEVLGTLADSENYDLVCMDAMWLARFGGQVYAMPSTESHTHWADLQAGLYDLGKLYAPFYGGYACLPLDISPQLLLYRKDLFENYKIKREFTELYGEELCVPTDFRQYNRVARFFTQKYNSASPTWYGAVCNYQDPLAAYEEFLPRLVCNGAGQKPLTREIVLESLQQFVSVGEYVDKFPSSPGSLNSFSGGNAAMCLTTSSNCTPLVNSKHSQIVGNIGFADVPGGRPLVRGILIGLGRQCRQPGLASGFLHWLYSHEVATALTFLGCLSPSRTVYHNTNIIDLFPWLAQTGKWVRTGFQGQLFGQNSKQEPQTEAAVGITLRSVMTKIISVEQAAEHLALLLE